MANLIAIDVGINTGIAMTSGDHSYQTLILKSAQEVWSMLKIKKWDTVIYESFQAVMISGYGLYTVQLIGGIRALCMEYGLKCVCQPPQARSAYMEKAAEILKGQPYLPHQKDALAHLLLFENIVNISQGNQKTPV